MVIVQNVQHFDSESDRRHGTLGIVCLGAAFELAGVRIHPPRTKRQVVSRRNLYRNHTGGTEATGS